MSLKDKAKPLIVWNDFTPIQEADSKTQLVKLADAEEEIEKIKNKMSLADAYCSSCDAFIADERVTYEECCDECGTEIQWLDSKDKEIQTLVELLHESKFTLNDCVSELKEMGYSEDGNTLTSVKKIKKRIIQTLKKYEK